MKLVYLILWYIGSGGGRQFLNIRNNDTNFTKNFKYLEGVHNSFQLLDGIDSKISGRMDPISLEDNWKTTRWPTRVLNFLLAVTEVNSHINLIRIFHNSERSQKGFR